MKKITTIVPNIVATGTPGNGFGYWGILTFCNIHPTTIFEEGYHKQNCLNRLEKYVNKQNLNNVMSLLDAYSFKKNT